MSTVRANVRYMYEVKSSMLHKVGYDDVTRRLVVQFTNLSVYHYYFVPPDIVCALLNAKSVGVYFTTNIKTKYDAKCAMKPKKKQE